eukprot:164754_1
MLINFNGDFCCGFIVAVFLILTSNVLNKNWVDIIVALAVILVISNLILITNCLDFVIAVGIKIIGWIRHHMNEPEDIIVLDVDEFEEKQYIDTDARLDTNKTALQDIKRACLAYERGRPI